MFKVYYCKNFKKEESSSHELLEKAIAMQLTAEATGNVSEAELAHEAGPAAEIADSSTQAVPLAEAECHASELGQVVEAVGSTTKSSSNTELGFELRAKELVASMYKCSEYGKPRIDDFREFSISHSANCWAVLIADNCCGFDIQEIKAADIEGVSKRMFSDLEQASIARLGIEEFFRLWARRESLVKAVGTTIVNRNIPSVLCDELSFEDRLWHVRDIKLPGVQGFTAACCVELEGSELEGPVGGTERASDRGIEEEEVIYVEIV